MSLAPFPPASSVAWRRLDVPGREEAEIRLVPGGWHLSGSVGVEEAHFSYRIDVDEGWRTRSALVEGRTGAKPFRIELSADGRGNWFREGEPVPALTGAFDVDLGFTPATNTLPIRRLDLAVGESAPVASAWLRFPEPRLERLEQVYTRESELSFRYRAEVDGEPFIARLDVDEFGRIVTYEGLWKTCIPIR